MSNKSLKTKFQNLVKTNKIQITPILHTRLYSASSFKILQYQSIPEKITEAYNKFITWEFHNPSHPILPIIKYSNNGFVIYIKYLESEKGAYSRLLNEFLDSNNAQ